MNNAKNIINKSVSNQITHVWLCGMYKITSDGLWDPKLKNPTGKPDNPTGKPDI